MVLHRCLRGWARVNAPGQLGESHGAFGSQRSLGLAWDAINLFTAGWFGEGVKRKERDGEREWRERELLPSKLKEK